jgi:uncharacterized protein YdhG (YjbR/CyaY superfamily)
VTFVGGVSGDFGPVEQRSGMKKQFARRTRYSRNESESIDRHPARTVESPPATRPLKGRMDMADAKTTARRSSTTRASGNVWSKEERAAVQETARERKKSAKLSPEEERAEGEADVQAKIAGMPADDRAMAARIHKLVLETVPALVPKTYYGMPAYARDGKVICFFKPKSKFKARYSTFEFQADAGLDDGEMWPVSFAIVKLTPATEKRIAELVKRGASRP